LGQVIGGRPWAGGNREGVRQDPEASARFRATYADERQYIADPSSENVSAASNTQGTVTRPSRVESYEITAIRGKAAQLGWDNERLLKEVEGILLIPTVHDVADLVPPQQKTVLNRLSHRDPDGSYEESC
jgi:hypothetical protein